MRQLVSLHPVDPRGRCALDPTRHTRSSGTEQNHTTGYERFRSSAFTLSTHAPPSHVTFVYVVYLVIYDSMKYDSSCILSDIRLGDIRQLVCLHPVDPRTAKSSLRIRCILGDIRLGVGDPLASSAIQKSMSFKYEPSHVRESTARSAIVNQFLRLRPFGDAGTGS